MQRTDKVKNAKKYKRNRIQGKKRGDNIKSGVFIQESKRILSVSKSRREKKKN
jgi:hypothetical protein